MWVGVGVGPTGVLVRVPLRVGVGVVPSVSDGRGEGDSRGVRDGVRVRVPVRVSVGVRLGNGVRVTVLVG